MRQGECLSLHRTDVELEARTLLLRCTLERRSDNTLEIVAATKTASSFRRVELPEIVAEALRRQRSRQAASRLAKGAAWEDNDLVFPNGLGRPLNPTNLLRRVPYPLLEAAGLPKVRFHDLRHTAATLLLTERVPTRVVSDLLGHAQTGTTSDLYQHVTPTMLSEAASAMDRVLSPDSTPLAVSLAVSEVPAETKPQVGPRSSGDRASVS
jgi:integrase